MLATQFSAKLTWVAMTVPHYIRSPSESDEVPSTSSDCYAYDGEDWKGLGSIPVLSESYAGIFNEERLKQQVEHN